MVGDREKSSPPWVSPVCRPNIETCSSARNSPEPSESRALILLSEGFPAWPFARGLPFCDNAIEPVAALAIDLVIISATRLPCVGRNGGISPPANPSFSYMRPSSSRIRSSMRSVKRPSSDRIGVRPARLAMEGGEHVLLVGQADVVGLLEAEERPGMARRGCPGRTAGTCRSSEP